MAKFDGTGNNKDIFATAGDDDIVDKSGSNAIYAGAGNDKVTVGDAGYTIWGEAGNDNITAGSGNDIIDGGIGDDKINSGSGDNTVTGGDGNDEITAGSGNDKIDGGIGDDKINSGDGNNTITGGNGNDNITAGSGNDIIDGGIGNDKINAGGGNNTITGGDGNDTITAGSGSDKIDGGIGDDKIDAGGGNDTIIGGAGSDDLTGGAGADTFVYASMADSNDSKGGGADTISDFTHGVDKIDVTALLGPTVDLAWGGAVATANGLWVTHDGKGDKAKTHVWADVDGNAKADLHIVLEGNVPVDQSDFLGVGTKVNAAPVAQADTLSATEDTASIYTAAELLGNDSDVDGPALTIASVTSGTGGTAVLNGDGTVTFTPTANFNGVADFTYKATDGTLESNVATATVNVAAVNDAPVAQADTLSATEDTASIYTAAELLGNDSDVDGPALTIASVTSGTGGTAVLNGDGTVTFTPTANFNGVANFTYKATDGTLESNVATATVNVAAVDDAPVAQADTLSATEDTASIYTAAELLGNDSDVDGPALTIASVTSGTGGTAVLNGDGTVTFTPTANFNGVADFTYKATDGTLESNVATATVNVAAVNDAPVAQADTLSATEDTASIYTAAELLGNDSDVDGPALTIASVTSGTGGTAVLNGDGTVTFTPTANFNGVADFTYKATDGTLESNVATATVNVAAVNDAPVAQADTLSATEDTASIYTAAELLGNDSDVDGPALTIASVTSGTGGTAVLNGDGTVTFTPTANFNGVADFTYKATDGTLESNVATATVNVAAVNDAPVAQADTLSATEDTASIYTAAELLGNDSDVDGPALTIASVTSGTGGTAVLNGDGTVTFTPTANFNGVADFTYKATDGTLESNVATATVNVAAVNDAPVAQADTLSATEDTASIYTAAELLGNDSDVDGPALTIASVTSGTGGTAVLNGDGTVTFTPTANFNGVADFTYKATDGTLESNVATATVNVAAVNDAPVAQADTLSATEDTASIYTAAELLGNDSDVDGPALTIASVTSGTGGTAVLNGDGTVTFTPTANFNGVADFTYKATDGTLESNVATATVNVAAVNDAPVAQADTLSATEDTASIYTAAELLGNDSDVDGPALTIASVTSGTGGTAVLNGDGTVTFTPTANFNGVADFTYKATDGTLESNVATATVNVAAVNDAPVAQADTLSATEDTASIYTAAELLGNDSDVDGPALTIASVTSGTGGTAVLNGDGTVTFTPTANFNGVADFTYKATDGTLESNVATATVNVAAVNDAPVAQADTLSATEDTASIYTAAELLGNDSDVDGPALTIASVTSGTGGTAVLNGDGTVTFTPTANFNGVADFTYKATDGTLESNVATATVNVAAVNDAPVAQADTLSATEDTASIYTAAELLGNDSDVDGPALTIASVTSGTGGTAVLNGDGTVTFTPTANFNGVADFTYKATDGTLESNVATATVNVAAVNDAPVAQADTLSATEDTASIYTAAELLGNDSDVDGPALTIASVTSGTGGTAVLNGDGTVTFTPTANFNGVADFTYKATDGTLESNVATATVNVAAVNDAPVAQADTLSATEDTASIYTAAELLGNDSDVDGPALTIASVTSGTGGTAVLNGDGTVTFTPTANFNGVADFTYKATDGTLESNVATATVNVAAVNDAPVAQADTLSATEDTASIYTAAELLGNDSDVDGPALTIASVTSGTGGTAVLNGDGTVTFTPTANFNGVANFTYKATDGTLESNVATATVNVAAVNDAPVAQADTLSATEDTASIYTAAELLGNDSDVDGPALTIASVTSGTGGTAVLNGDGTVTFTPTANFNGVADFTYKATDGTLESNVATATVNVAAVNDAPVAQADTLSATEDTASIYTAAELLGNDSDVDGPALTIASVTSGTGGTAVLNGDGTVTFTPTANFNGVADFTYKATDGTLESNVATATVNVAAVNDAPVAQADTLSATEDTASIYTAAELLGNDSDVDGPALTIASVTSGTGGTAVLNGDGTVTFTPTANFNGVADFTYKATDGTLESNVATATVNVAAVNDAPVAQADTLSATEDTASIYTAAELLGNDSDVDGPALTIASVTSGTGGTAVLNGDGTVTFTPTANFNGVADFTYKATDGTLESNVATATVNVAAVNDAPVAQADTLSATEDTASIYTAAELLGNDSDVDGPALTIASVTSGTGGTAVLNGDGTVTFTPTANFNGVANFTYKATDGTLESNVATATVNVAAVNDAPVAQADTLSATKDTASIYTAAQLLGNDSDVDGPALTIASVTSGTGGTAVLNGDGTVTFTPTANFTGVANFTYKATDGTLESNVATATVNVAAVDAAPVFTSGASASVAENLLPATTVYTAVATDDGGSVSYSLSAGSDNDLFNINASTGIVTFKASPNFEAKADSDLNNVYDITVHAKDGSHDTTKAVAITVTDVTESPPAANADLVLTNVGVGVAGIIVIPEWALLHNDIGNDVASGSVGKANAGDTVSHTAGVGAEGSVTYSDLVSANGQFSYKASDGFDSSAEATVKITDKPTSTSILDSSDSDTIIVSAANGDTLIGGKGDDVLLGNNGDDTLNGGKISNDILDGGAGTDLIDLSDATSAVTFTLVQSASFTTVNLTSVGLGVDLYANMEGVRGSAFADSLTGSAGADRLEGGLGNDTIDGGAGDDTITGDDGNDVITAGPGNDTITGGKGDDVITLSGGGNDTIVFSAAASNGKDTVNSFTAGDVAAIQGGDTSAGTASGGNAVFVELTVSKVAGGTAYGLDALGDTKATEVWELRGGNEGNANLAGATNGDELLKYLATTGAASQITVDNHDDAFFMVAYDNGNAYLFHGDSGGDFKVVTNEIQLVGVFTGVTNFNTGDFKIA